MKVVMDSDCLIKLTRAKAKEVVLRNIEVCIPPKVFEETVTIPKNKGYPDAVIIEDNQKNGCPGCTLFYTNCPYYIPF